MKKALSLASIEFKSWFFDARMVIILILLIFIKQFAIEPLIENSQLMNEPLNILEPLIAIANSGNILLIVPLVFLTLIADFPKINTSTVFYISRIGRTRWLVAQIINLIFMVTSFLVIICLGAIIPIIGKGVISRNWSKVVLEFATTFPEKSGNFGVRLLPENLYNQLSIVQSAIESYAFVFTYLIILGLILLLFSLIRMKIVGFVISGAVILLGTAFCAIRSKLMWTMPMAHTIIWLHYTKYFREPVMSIKYSVIYLITFIVILLTACFAAIRHFNYDNVSEVEM